ncbi:MAG: hypothetical protein KDA91_21980, partial [Planctomycetaceae bacterium]|nr:hypothetical protein [Planctomycetaceae bacterium]
RAIEASVEAEVDHDLVKSAILRAWMVYSRSQGNSPVHFFSKNPMPEHLDFLNQFRKALVRAENSSSPAIQTIASALLDRNW